MARQGNITKKGETMEKEFKTKLKEVLKPLGNVTFKPNRSYIAIWLKRKKKQSDLILCLFEGKKKRRLCLPWSTLDLPIDNLPSIVSEFLAFKKNNSISKNIKALEKILKEKSLI